MIIMELSFSQLKKREVINVSDGRSLGYPIDITLSFPKGAFSGITVPGNRKNCILRLFDRNKTFIDERRILKIGSDVILVDVKCGDACGDNVDLTHRQKGREEKPPCPPPCGPCKPQKPLYPDCEELFGSSEGRIDTGDY